MMLRFQFEFPQHHAPGFDASPPVSEGGLATTAHLEDTVGSGFAKPGHLGRSIARSVVAAILRTYSGRRCWYLTRTENLASMSIASASKLRPIGRASRSSRFGLRLLGSFRPPRKDERCPL